MKRKKCPSSHLYFEYKGVEFKLVGVFNVDGEYFHDVKNVKTGKIKRVSDDTIKKISTRLSK